MSATGTRLVDAAPDRTIPGITWNARLAYPVVFAAGGAILLIEITAGRLLAPVVGVSLETWTGIIGVVLAGFALGDALVGRLADRFPSPRLLAAVLALAGGAVILAAPVRDLMYGALLEVPVLLRVTVISGAVLLPPFTLLGSVLPAATRLTLRSTDEAGRVAGGLSAVSTASNVLGVAVGGFILLEHAGVRTILDVAAAVLLIFALIPFVARSAERGLAPPPARGVGVTAGALATLLLAGAGGAGIMMVELAATRIVAPLFGSSLYTWAAVIGAVLLGISVGNALGGWLADRHPSRGLLGAALILAGAATLLVLLLPFLYSRALSEFTTAVLARLSPAFGLPLLVGVMLLPPAAGFGALSPIIIRLTLRHPGEAGRIVGRVYAAQAIGSIAGTFAAGFWLIGLLGARAVILLVAQGVVLLGIVIGTGTWRIRPALRWVAAAACVLAAAAAATGRIPSPCLRESNYYCIRILEQGDGLRALVLDSLIHSYVDLRRPDALAYDYERGWAVLLDEVAARRVPGAAPLRALFIGGGGYTFPRYMQSVAPDSRIEVVEIDPAVTAVTQAELGLPTDTTIRTWNEDGRQFFLRRPQHRYDLILLDVFRDAYSIPYHLTTREFAEQVAGALAPQGVYAVNIVDGRPGLFVRAYARTLQRVFPYVYLLPAGEDWRQNVQTIFVLFASRRPLDLADLMRRRPPGVHAPLSLVPLAPEELAAFLNAGPPGVLSDDHAPVEPYLARVYAEVVRSRQR